MTNHCRRIQGQCVHSATPPQQSHCNSNGQYVQTWHLFYGHASKYLLFADNFAPLSLKGRVLFKHNIQEGVLPFLNDRICIWSRLHNIEKNGCGKLQLNTKNTLCTWMRSLHVTHIHKKSKPAVHDSPVFHSHTNTHLLEISSPHTGIWSDEFFFILVPCRFELWCPFSLNRLCFFYHRARSCLTGRASRAKSWVTAEACQHSFLEWFRLGFVIEKWQCTYKYS